MEKEACQQVKICRCAGWMNKNLDMKPVNVSNISTNWYKLSINNSPVYLLKHSHNLKTAFKCSVKLINSLYILKKT